MICSKCQTRESLPYHAYCRECRIAYRKENPETRHPYIRHTPFPETCAKCGQHPTANNSYWCQLCKNESTRQWARRNPNWKNSTPERRQKNLARALVNGRLDRGQLLKLACFICDEKEVTAHHYLGYDKEHALDIIWLCNQHHREAEKELWCPIIPKDYSLKTPLTPKTFEERFWSKVEKTLDCWLYKGRLSPLGYGQFDIEDGRMEGAHRTSWKLANGEIPEDCIIGHLCNVRNCVRPDHLVAWPKGDDIRYMEQCGRGVHLAGEENGRAKLNEDSVRSIRKNYVFRKFGCYKLAQIHGVSPQVIFDIVNFKTWQQVK
jgi:hypothetical protein